MINDGFSSVNKNGRGYHTHLRITNQELAKLLKVHVNTVRRYIREKRFDPTSLESIIEYHLSDI